MIFFKIIIVFYLFFLESVKNLERAFQQFLNWVRVYSFKLCIYSILI